MIPGQETNRRLHHSAESPRRGPDRPWLDLPSDLLRDILLKLTCRADRVYFGAVCQPWRSAAHGLDAPRPQLPWLVFPSPVAPSFFSLHSGATRPLYLPEKVRAASIRGSHDGGWVALAFGEWGGYAAVNLLSGATVPLPDRLRTSHRTDRHGDDVCVHPMAIRTVTFSAAPSAEGCLAAAQVSSAYNLAFWRPGMDRHWVAHGPPVDVIQDIIYHKNELYEGFRVLSDTEDVAVYSHIASPAGSLLMSRSSYQVQRRVGYKRDLPRCLVESRGKLLMVVLQLRKGRKFRIFEMLNLGTGGSQVSWVELYTLPGRLLLLGRGCSRAFEVSHFENHSSLQLGTNIDTDIGVHVDKSLNCKDPTWRSLSRFTSQCSRPIWFAP